MICKNCGSENENDAVFCNNCGANMSGGTLSDGYAKRPPETDTLGSATVLDYKNPEQPKPDGPMPVLHHYESRSPEEIAASYSHPRTYSPSYAAPPMAYAPVYEVPAYGVPVHTVSADPDSGKRVIERLKQIIRCPAMMVGTIAFSLTALCFILTLFGINGLYDALSDSLSPYRYYVSEARDAISVLQLVTWLVGFLAFIPTLLTVIGLWMMVAQGFKYENRISTTGISMIKGVKIFEFVLFCISVVISFVFLIASGSELISYSYMPAQAVAIYLILFVFIVGYIVWKFFYFTSLFRTMDSFRDSVLFRSPSGYPSVLVAVDSFLSAAGNIFAFIFLIFPVMVSSSYGWHEDMIISMFRDLTNGYGTYYALESFKGSMDLISFSSTFSAIAGIVAFISFGVMSIIYRNRLSYIRYER